MNFQDLFKLWRREGILSRTINEFVAMIDDSHWMFQRAATSLWEETDVEKRKEELYERDIAVNKAERSNRKKLVEHLSIDPGGDANYCLVLMSVMKDAERVGDYCKNLFEISQYHPTCDFHFEMDHGPAQHQPVPKGKQEQGSDGRSQKFEPRCSHGRDHHHGCKKWK